MGYVKINDTTRERITGGPGKKGPGIRSPEWKDFSPITSDGNLLDRFSMNPSSLEGYGQLKDLATGTGLSSWGQAAQNALDTRLNFDREALMRQGQSATGQAMSNLMSQGGLTSGARERIQRGGIKDTLAARQQASQSGLLGSADIAMKDAASRQQALGGLLELGFKGRASDIDTATRDIRDRREFEMGKWKTDVSRDLANQKADELMRMASQGGGKK